MVVKHIADSQRNCFHTRTRIVYITRQIAGQTLYTIDRMPKYSDTESTYKRPDGMCKHFSLGHQKKKQKKTTAYTPTLDSLDRQTDNIGCHTLHGIPTHL